MIARVLLIGLVFAGVAAGEVRLAAELATPPPILVGQRVTLVVTLSSPTPFTMGEAFDVPRVPGAIVTQPQGHPVLGADGSLLTQRHELAFVAQRPGTFTIPAFEVRVGDERLRTPPFTVTATLPAGVPDGLGLVATRAFSVAETWTPQPGQARVGDAFIRTVTRTVADVPAMVLGPLPLGETGSLAAYPKPPVVTDASERGDVVGTRIDAVTYVCTAPGEVTLPAVTFRWWDLARGALVTETLPAVTFTVGAAPATSRAWLERAILVALLTGVLLWRRRELATWWRRRRAARAVSEAGRFAAIGRACRANDARAAHAALLDWLAVVRPRPRCPVLAEDLLAVHPDPDLARQVAALEDAVVAPSTSWDGAALVRALETARPHGRLRRGAGRLPELNPSS